MVRTLPPSGSRGPRLVCHRTLQPLHKVQLGRVSMPPVNGGTLQPFVWANHGKELIAAGRSVFADGGSSFNERAAGFPPTLRSENITDAHARPGYAMSGVKGRPYRGVSEGNRLPVQGKPVYVSLVSQEYVGLDGQRRGRATREELLCATAPDVEVLESKEKGEMKLVKVKRMPNYMHRTFSSLKNDERELVEPEKFTLDARHFRYKAHKLSQYRTTTNEGSSKPVRARMRGLREGAAMMGKAGAMLPQLGGMSKERMHLQSQDSSSRSTAASTNAATSPLEETTEPGHLPPLSFQPPATSFSGSVRDRLVQERKATRMFEREGVASNSKSLEPIPRRGESVMNATLPGGFYRRSSSLDRSEGTCPPVVGIENRNSNPSRPNNHALARQGRTSTAGEQPFGRTKARGTLDEHEDTALGIREASVSLERHPRHNNICSFVDELGVRQKKTLWHVSSDLYDTSSLSPRGQGLHLPRAARTSLESFPEKEAAQKKQLFIQNFDKAKHEQETLSQRRNPYSRSFWNPADHYKTQTQRDFLHPKELAKQRRAPTKYSRSHGRSMQKQFYTTISEGFGARDRRPASYSPVRGANEGDGALTTRSLSPAQETARTNASIEDNVGEDRTRERTSMFQSLENTSIVADTTMPEVVKGKGVPTEPPPVMPAYNGEGQYDMCLNRLQLLEEAPSEDSGGYLDGRACYKGVTWATLENRGKPPKKVGAAPKYIMLNDGSGLF
ncbi:unnamed protein product [Amoebophrya sp. A25]|nr:unnamed protein product [Amoebophrya sp. A25]|eukprot:GSA25T00022530001.1